VECYLRRTTERDELAGVGETLAGSPRR